MISRLHIVTDDRILSAPNFLANAHIAMASGAGRTTFHLRGPRTKGRTLWELALALRPAAIDHNVRMVVNDRVDLALTVKADGAHLGARSLPVIDTRRLLGQDVLIGCSVHDGAEAGRLLSGGSGPSILPDYLLAGAMFTTPSHLDRPAGGVHLMRVMSGALPSVPVLGIGGVTAERIPEILEGGAHGVAVVRAVWDAPNTGVAVSRLLESLDRSVPGSGI